MVWHSKKQHENMESMIGRFATGIASARSLLVDTPIK
jgi:hypothetical protein